MSLLLPLRVIPFAGRRATAGGGNPNPFGFLMGVDGAGSTASRPNPTVISGMAFTVYVGDLIYIVSNEIGGGAGQISVTDNLGNSYTGPQADSNSGSATGRAFYARVTVPGVLTDISMVTVAHASNGYTIGAAVFAGPFLDSPLDRNPSNLADVSSPHNCPASTTLTQAIELVLGWAAHTSGGGRLDAITVGTQAFSQGSGGGGNPNSKLAYVVTASTASVTITWTSTTNPAGCVLGTSTFMAA